MTMTRWLASLPGHLKPASGPTPSPNRYTGMELAGGLGDLGTFLPLAVAMAMTSAMDLGVILVLTGLMNVATGWLFRQPIPVQPMKAIAAVAITEGLRAEEIAAAGMFMGLAMILIAWTGLITRIEEWVPKPVVRGIQLGIGCKLALHAIQEWIGLPILGWDSQMTAVVVTAILITLAHRAWALPAIFLTGFLLLAIIQPTVYESLALTLPAFSWVTPTGADWWTGLTRGTIPQLPLTVLNSVIAVCALSADYFPKRGIPTRAMAASVGFMNLATIPFGGMPACHGAGGLAAQHRFGARTGGSVIMLGGLKILVGLLTGGSLAAALQAYPAAILSVMLLLAAWTLAKAARDCLVPPVWPIVAATALFIVILNTLYGFVIGWLLFSISTSLRSWVNRS